MTMKNTRTAADVMAWLQADPRFVAAQAKRDAEHAARVAANREAEKPIVASINEAADLRLRTVNELKGHFPLVKPVVQCLLGWIPRLDSKDVKEALIRLLGGAADPFEGRVLVDAFAEGDDALRFAVVNTMALAAVDGVDDWLLGALEDDSLRSLRGIFALAVARNTSQERGLPALYRVFEQVPADAAEAMSKLGGEPEIAFLTRQIDAFSGPSRKRIAAAMKRLGRRANQT